MLMRNRNFWIAIVVVLSIVIGSGATSIWEYVDANKIVVIQSAIEGRLDWHTTAGLKWQWFGDVTTYPKRGMYEFNDNKIRFNDGGFAIMEGSIQYDYPLNTEKLTKIHTQYGSAEAVESDLVKKVVDKCTYMTGPLLSSKESYAEKRNELLSYVENQVKFGIFETTSEEIKIIDLITGIEKTKTSVEIVSIDGVQQYQGTSILTDFGLFPYNFAIEKLGYDQTVEDQIKQQQEITMDVQTAIAGAKKAEQRTLTVVEEGKADAAKAKWEQEVIKARAVVLAEQQLAVAKLDAQAAEQEKIAQILRGEGEATYKRKVMQADGALAQKLATYERVSQMYATAIAAYKGAWVPHFNMPTSGVTGDGTGTDPAFRLINMLTAQTARNLALDPSITGSNK